MPSPKRATGTHASQVSERLVLNPRMLLRRSMGPSRRLASWRRALLRLEGECRADVMKEEQGCDDFPVRTDIAIGFKGDL